MCYLTPTYIENSNDFFFHTRNFTQNMQGLNLWDLKFFAPYCCIMYCSFQI